MRVEFFFQILLAIHLSSNFLPAFTSNSTCFVEEDDIAICNLECFEDIPDVFPDNKDIKNISKLSVVLNEKNCSRHYADQVFGRFKSLKEISIYGKSCPFLKLSNIYALDNVEMFSPAIYRYSKEGANQQENLPFLKNLTIRNLCCELFRGHFTAPQLEDLTFQCFKVDAFISGVNKTRNVDVNFIVPRLKRLTIEEHEPICPVSSVDDLPDLNFLAVNKLLYKEFTKMISKLLYLPSLKELQSKLYYAAILARKYTGCSDLGGVNLTEIFADYPTSVCPSTWKCSACHPDVSNTNQNAHISVRDRIFPPLMNYVFPKTTINTTNLIVEIPHLLTLDQEAMSRFSKLQTLTIGTVVTDSSLTDRSEKVVLIENAFKALQRPQDLQFIRLPLIECDCLEYHAFKWLKAQNAQFEGEIMCSKLPENESSSLIPDQWIKVSEFFVALESTCESLSEEDLSKISQERAERYTNGKSSIQMKSSIIFTISLVVLLNNIYHNY